MACQTEKIGLTVLLFALFKSFAYQNLRPRQENPFNIIINLRYLHTNYQEDPGVKTDLKTPKSVQTTSNEKKV